MAVHKVGRFNFSLSDFLNNYYTERKTKIFASHNVVLTLIPKPICSLSINGRCSLDFPQHCFIDIIILNTEKYFYQNIWQTEVKRNLTGGVHIFLIFFNLVIYLRRDVTCFSFQEKFEILVYFMYFSMIVMTFILLSFCRALCEFFK